MSEQTAPELAEKIRRFLTTKNAAALRRMLARHNFADVAEVMETLLDEQEAKTCFQYLNMGQAAMVLNSLNEERQAACLSALPSVMGSKILRQMASDDAADILQEMDIEQSRKILDEMPMDVDFRELQSLLLEEPDTAAGLMSTNYIEVNVNGSVRDALNKIRQAEEKDFIYYIYVVDDAEKLVGVISLKRLILHDESVPLERITEFDVKSILTSYDQELVANLFRKYYNLLAMPTVDEDNVLRGVITIDDIIEVIEEESTEDIYQASGINLEEIDERGLLVGSSINAVKARMPWLMVTVVGQLLAAYIIATNAETVKGAVIAISFMPLLTGLTGNMGTQTNTISVRGLSQNLITADNLVEKLWRELKVAITIGGSFGIFVGGISYFLYHHWELSALLLVWITIALCLSAVFGMIVPYTCDRIFKIDPASVGGPLITTVSDIMTFSLYLYALKLLLDRMI